MATRESVSRQSTEFQGQTTMLPVSVPATARFPIESEIDGQQLIFPDRLNRDSECLPEQQPGF